ncbi:MAG: hypothetical protein DWQ06_14930 [Calditrichaeota bacterium]|nr:MAG: hypothetical protein DWQ06_14930 [Calditrichota bacterium]
MFDANYLKTIVKEILLKIEQENINFLKFKFDDFSLINFYLINEALNQEKYNLFIQIPDKELKTDFYLPLILSVSCTLFKQNFIDDVTEFKVGDILQRDNQRWELKAKRGKDYFLEKRDKNKTKMRVNELKINTFTITTAHLTNRRTRTKFNHYKNLFKVLFNINEFPSKFSYKTVIIIEKKDFYETIKSAKLNEIELQKALPFQWISKNGIEKEESEFIPIEPMIYLVPDYTTFQEHLSNRVKHLESVIFVGKTKYQNDLSKINLDLRNETIPKAIFIGSENIESFENQKSWKWTIPEIKFFQKEESSKVSFIETLETESLKIFKELEIFIKKIDYDYNFSLKNLLRLKKLLFALVIFPSTSRLDTQVREIRSYFKTNFEQEIKTSFFNIGKDLKEFKDFIDKTNTLLDYIFDKLRDEKYQIFLNEKNVDCLILPPKLKGIYEEEFQKDVRFQRIKIFSIKEFIQNEKQFDKIKNVYFLSVFGHNLLPNELISKIKLTSHNFHFIVYEEEKVFFEKILKCFQNEIIKELNSIDRVELSGIQYPQKLQIEESISDILDKFYEKEEQCNPKYNYEPTESLSYEIEFEDGTNTTLEANKTILFEKSGVSRKEIVSNLLENDKIRIYENSSKEKLFEVASKEDGDGKLKEVRKHSELWKTALKEFYCDNFIYQREDLLKKLKTNGANIQLTTLNNWLEADNETLFPRTESLNAIQRTIHSQEFNEKFDKILESKNFYNGIMISLGRDLSDEIMDYILSKEDKMKGKILKDFSDEEIVAFIDENSRVRTIKSIKILENGNVE